MSKFNGITADQARTLSESERLTPEAALAQVENQIGAVSTYGGSNAVAYPIPKSKIDYSGAEWVLLTLATRGFNLDQTDLKKDGQNYMFNVTW